MQHALALYVGDALGRYGFGAGHPFGNDRLDAFWGAATRAGLDRVAHVELPVLASEVSLQAFHDQSYIQRVRRLSAAGFGFLDYGDTPAVPGIFEASAYVVGSVLAGADQLLSGCVTRVFVPIAGLHHARRDRAAGFCVFNDIGVLIEHLKQRGLTRIAYVDIDAHHGDGVYYAYEQDPGVFVADIHEDGNFLYPGSGHRNEQGLGAGTGRKLNIPLPPGADDAVFLEAWEEVEQFVRAARPEIILLQAGADSIGGDPLTHLALTPAAHQHATRRLCTLASEFAQGRVFAFGGGGYHRRNTAETWVTVAQELLRNC